MAIKDMVDIITESEIRGLLPQNDNRRLYIFDKIDSTNTYAKELARNGAPHGTVVISDMQTGGRGRMGREFFSPPSTSIYMSLIFRPQGSMESSQLITSCMAVAAAEAIDNVCGTNVQIKWVNDLFIGGKKIAGILTEGAVSFKSGALDFAIIGIGINVKSVTDKFPPPLLEIASSLEDETGRSFNRCEIISAVIMSMEQRLENLSAESFMEEYKKRSCIIGQRVAVTKADGKSEAIAVGIDENAGLIIKYDDGTKETLCSGDARIIKK